MRLICRAKIGYKNRTERFQARLIVKGKKVSSPLQTSGKARATGARAGRWSRMFLEKERTAGALPSLNVVFEAELF